MKGHQCIGSTIICLYFFFFIDFLSEGWSSLLMSTSGITTASLSCPGTRPGHGGWPSLALTSVTIGFIAVLMVSLVYD